MLGIRHSRATSVGVDHSNGARTKQDSAFLSNSNFMDLYIRAILSISCHV